MAACVNCNTENNNIAKFCKSCGTSLNSPTNAGSSVSQHSHCPSCSSNLAPGARFCKKCGASVSDIAATSLPSDTAGSSTVSASPATTSEAPGHVDMSPLPADASAAPPAKVDAPVAAAIPPAAKQTATPERVVSQAAIQPVSPSRHLAVGVLAAVVAAGLFGGGIYWWSKVRTPVVAASEPAAAPPTAAAPSSAPAPSGSAVSTQPALSSVPAAETAKAVVQASPDMTAEPANAPSASEKAAPVASAPTAPAETAPVRPMQAKHVPPRTKLESKAMTPTGNQDAFAAKVAALLAKADAYIASKQYDKAIATGENALVLDPDNASAKALIRNAKNKQLQALRTGTSLE